MKVKRMPGPLEIKGQSASPGFARGLLWLDPDPIAPVSMTVVGSPQSECAALSAALAAAVAQTAALMEQSQGDAAGILEFQLAMLEDDTFAATTAVRIASGESAASAWRAVLDAEIEEYKASQDEYFRARSADLEDIRDRVSSALSGNTASTIPPGTIFVGRDISPSRFLGHDWTGGGIVLREGSVTSHVAMLARQRGVPTLVGTGDAMLPAGVEALLDASAGKLSVDPAATAIAAFEKRRGAAAERARAEAAYAAKSAATADGTAVKLLVNIADPEDVKSIPVAHVDGVGLMRSEFLFSHGLPEEDRQFEAYATVLRWAQGKPVTIRTVDAGGDKPVPGFTLAESNPFLGVRGIRLCLEREDVFRVQIRALLRAATQGNLRVMLPMVSVPGEVERAIDLFQDEAAALGTAGIAHAIPPIGIMVEVPAVAITPSTFAKAAFFSIGSNDLTQYVMAASRDQSRLAYLANAANPAVLELMGRITDYGSRSRKDVSICGDAASEPDLLPALLGTGLRAFSVAAARIGAIKATIARCTLTEAA
jgi:phosphotransferase system enzyme I (PtsI)